MEVFEIKGDNGFVKIEIKEIFGFPDETSHFGGYECRADIEIKIPSYSAKGDFYTSTGQLFEFYEELKVCQAQLKGEVKYLTFEGNFALKIKYTELGHVEISGMFHQSMSNINCLEFEINSDQSFLNYTVEELEVITSKYGNNKGVNRNLNLDSDKDDKSKNWKFWSK